MSAPEKTPRIFYEHMHYVAFSRCTTLEGLHIIDINETKICASSSVLHFLEKEKRELELNFTPVYKDENQLAIAYNNVGSLPHKWSAIKDNKNITSSDIFILSETWLSAKHPPEQFELSGYLCLRMDSTYRVGHRGMLMYISEKHETLAYKRLQTEHIEVILCEVCVRGVLWNIVGMYKPPTTNQQTLLSGLQTIKSALHLDRHTVIVGDLNVNIHLPSGQWLVDFMEQQFHMRQVITSSTTWDGTLIDVMFTNNVSLSGHALGNTWSKHDVIYCVVPLNK